MGTTVSRYIWRSLRKSKKWWYCKQSSLSFSKEKQKYRNQYLQNTFYFSYSILVFCTEFNLGSLKLLQSEKVKFPLFMYKDLHALQINFTVDIPTQQWSTGISLHVFSIDLSTNLLIDLVLRTWFPLICLLLTSLSSIKNQSLVL